MVLRTVRRMVRGGRTAGRNIWVAEALADPATAGPATNQTNRTELEMSDPRVERAREALTRDSPVVASDVFRDLLAAYDELAAERDEYRAELESRGYWLQREDERPSLDHGDLEG